MVSVIVTNEEILWLEISVHNIPPMAMLKTFQDLCECFLQLVSNKCTILLHETLKVSVQELHHKLMC